MYDGYITREDAEILFKDYEKRLRRLRDSMLRVDEKIPGLSSEDRAVLVELVRETLTELAATDHVPAKIRQEWPDLAKRFDELAKVLIPPDQ